MSGHVLRFDASAHRRADLLLPWFANGTLDGEELAFVRRHVAECSRCRREVEWLREFAAMCADARAWPEPPARFGRIAAGIVRFRTAWRSAAARASRFWRRDGSWSRWAIAAQFCVIVAIGAAWVATRDSVAPYRTLGTTSAPARDAGSVVVVFDAQTTEGEMRRIVSAAGARIVDGPTERDAYVLAIAPERIAASLSMLEAQRAVVLAVPLGPRPSH